MKSFAGGMSAILVIALYASHAMTADHTTDSLDAVKSALKENKAVLLDVREQREWDAGHLSGAQLLPLSRLRTLDAEGIAKELPKGKVIYCHCAAGLRVLPAADALKKAGYDVRPLKAGYKELLQAGFPRAD